MTGRASPAREAGHERADDRLGRREAMLGWMEEVAPFGVFTTDTTLHVRSWNRWLVANSGLSEEAVLGRTLPALFPDIGARRLDEPYRRALAGQVVMLSTALHQYLLPLPPPSREFGVPNMLQTVRIAPLPADDGRIVGTITVIEDVTQRECQARILRRQQEHDRLLSSALAMLLESDTPLDIVAELFPRIAAPLKLEVYFIYLLNASGEQLHLHAAGGISPEARKNLATLQMDEDVCGAVARSQQSRSVGSVQASDAPPSALIRRLGLSAYACFPLQIGERVLGTLSVGSYQRDTIVDDELEFLERIAQYLALAIDRALRQDALREAQRSLSLHAEQLETKIAERTARLNETIQQLESFSYTVAHDLRAPIRALQGYSDILLEDYGAEMPGESGALVQRLRRASRRLDALTRDLLKFSKITRQEVSLGPVDVDELVRELVQITPALNESVVIVPPLGWVKAQRTLLQQCISNLLENAVKFGRKDVAPRIVVRAQALVPSEPNAVTDSTFPFHSSVLPGITPDAPTAANARLRLWIEDNGIGIDPQSHQKIFGMFERASGLDSVEGTGIGLAIVARSMQQMGGSCGVESHLGEGARFWLELEAETPPA